MGILIRKYNVLKNMRLDYGSVQDYSRRSLHWWQRFWRLLVGKYPYERDGTQTRNFFDKGDEEKLK